MRFLLDEETKEFLTKTKYILAGLTINVEVLLKEIGTYKPTNENSPAKILGANIFAVGSELLALQIVENLDKGFLLISLIGLRTLLENYINVNYIYKHPQHLKDYMWAEKLCRDFLKRTKKRKSMKNLLGGISLFDRAKSTGLEEFYNIAYADLCNYTHFLASVINVVEPIELKGRTIQAAIYTVTCFYDILLVIASFFETHFAFFHEEILKFKAEGKAILDRTKK